MVDTVAADASPITQVPDYAFIGKSMPIVEDRRFVRGRGRYINDIEIPGMLYLGVASAPVAHARIISIDVTKAKDAPGVVAVLTGADLVGQMTPIPQEIKLPSVNWYPLALDKIRYVGEWTAAVIATSRAAAEDAAELVEIEFEELAPVVDPIAALQPGAALLHEGHGSNLIWEQHFEWGDNDKVFAEADHVFEYEFRWHRHSGVPIETFGCVAHMDDNEMIDIWASHQNPGLQQEVTQVLQSRCRVNMDVDVGGSYGSKRGQKHMYLTGVAAKVTGRPVKFIEDRTENMQAGDGHGPDRRYVIQLAVRSDGVVQAIHISLVDDYGAFSGRGPKQLVKPTTALAGPYKIRNISYHAFGVFTCKTNQVPFRGAGQSPHNYCLERAMDQVARDLGIDRTVLRQRNYIQPEEFPYKTPSGSQYDSGNYPGAMVLAMEKAGYADLLAEQEAARKKGRLFGIGTAGAIEPSGSHGESREGARVEVDRRGRVTVTIGFQSAGQAHESMVTQIACEELGVKPQDVLVLRGNGHAGINGGATTGSRMTLRLGLALKGATDKINTKLRVLAAFALEASFDDIVADHGNYMVVGYPGSTLTLKELALKAYGENSDRPEGMEPGLVVGKVISKPEKLVAPDKGTMGFPSYAFDFHIPVIEIDPETYEISFRQYTVVHDCGVQINPLVVDGFVFGGIGHGIGGAMYEDFHYDEESGQLVASSFMDYLCPTATEIPHVDLHTLTTPSPMHPYGAKGTAEGAYMTAPAAVASAIEDAIAPLGLRINEVPATPQLIFNLLRNKEKGGEQGSRMSLAEVIASLGARDDTKWVDKEWSRTDTR